MIHTPTSHWASSDLWNPRCGGSVGMVQTVPELHGNHLFTHVLICMAASFLSSGVFVCCFLSYPGKIWFFLIDTCWEHGNIPHLHLLLPSAEWEHKPVSRFLELSTAQIRVSPCLSDFEAWGFDLYPYSHYDISRGFCVHCGDKHDFPRWLSAR